MKKKQALSEILKQVKELDERFVTTKNDINFSISQLTLQIEQLRKQADRKQIQETIESWKNQKSSINASVGIEDNKVYSYDTSILEYESKLKSINNLTREKEKEQSELSIIERKVERLAFIREGLSKNGIPALIIHNVGIDVAQIANDFLKEY